MQTRIILSLRKKRTISRIISKGKSLLEVKIFKRYKIRIIFMNICIMSTRILSKVTLTKLINLIIILNLILQMISIMIVLSVNRNLSPLAKISWSKSGKSTQRLLFTAVRSLTCPSRTILQNQQLLPMMSIEAIRLARAFDKVILRHP